MNLGDRIKASGLSRAAFYNRLSRGMSPDQALSTPKGRRVTGPTLRESVQRARSMGALKVARAPTPNVFGKLKGAGVPALLAVLTGRQAIEVSIQMERRAKGLMDDPHEVVRLMQSPPFMATLRALLQNMGDLSGEQVKSVLLNLTEIIEDGNQTAEPAQAADPQHSAQPDPR